MPRTFALTTLLMVCVLPVATPGAAYAEDPAPVELPRGVDKIDGRIRFHERLKKLYRDDEVARNLGRARVDGMDLTQLDRETCALYVTHALSPAEEALFEARGIAIDDDLYIPALDNHPYGFHIATIPYTELGFVESNPRVVMVSSLEIAAHPQNNLAIVQMKADLVHEGEDTVGPFDGSGISIAIADSGIDLDHPDFPEPEEAYDVWDGTTVSSWGTDVSNTVIMHGTHVAGSALGRGTQSDGNTGNGGGDYRGGAPGADFYFYKIGNDTTGSTFQSVEIRAIDRAVDQGCDIFTMSYGGFSNYLDGSNSACQAFDSAVEDGVVVFVSAGNEAQADKHYSEEIAPGEESTTIFLTIRNFFSTESYTDLVSLQVNWIDDDSDDRQMEMTCDNLDTGEDLDSGFSGSSVRGTEVHFFTLTPDVAAGVDKTYELVIENTATSGDTPLVHVHAFGDFVTFDDADSSYTVTVPALADDVIAVGAWAQRDEWTDENGTDWSRSWDVNELAPFSSLGPRIDGHQKPDLCAPGASTISCRDGDYANGFSRIIDNDGEDLDGSGPSEYYVAQGTSMAAPMAAGAAALLLESNSGLTPEEVYDFLVENAANGGTADDDTGFGLIDIEASIAAAVDCNDNGIVDAVEIEDGTADDCDGNAVLDECETIVVEIVGQPEDESVCELDRASFLITASGPASFTYQWQEDTGSGFVDMDGENSRVLNVVDVDFDFDGNQYRCVAMSACGDVTTEAATLTVEPVPALDEDLEDVDACTGESASLVVAVTAGPSVTYEWFHDAIVVPDANAATLEIDEVGSSDDGFYWVTATSVCGAVTSSVVELNVRKTPEVTEDPVVQTVCAGDPVLFEFSYSGSNPVSAQWFKDGAELEGATEDSFEIAEVTLDNAGFYSATASNDCGDVSTVEVELTVESMPTIASSEAVVQEDPLTVEFSAEVEGSDPLTYFWLFDDGEDSDEETPTHVYEEAGNYSVVLTVTNDCGSVVDTLLIELVLETELFLRGDADGNGSVFPIVDALFILEYGFSNGPVPPCLDAADSDGNNNVFPIVDALHLLAYGFTNGPAPPDPGPDDCGSDPTDDDVTCETDGC